MVTQELQLAILENARARRVRWNEIADAVLNLEAQSLMGPNGRPWIQIAADRSKFTTNQLRRMTRVVQFTRRLVVDGMLKNDLVLSSMRFSHLETAMRIHAFEPETALKIFSGEWIKPNYPDLVALYQSLRESIPASHSPLIAGKRAARRFQDMTFDLLQEAAFLELGPTRSLGRMIYGSRYANPDFLIVTRYEGQVTQVDGIDCYALTGPSQKEVAMKRVLQVAIESTFFTDFWVVLPEEDYVMMFQSEAKLLNLNNVGFIIVDQSKNSILKSLPSYNYQNQINKDAVCFDDNYISSEFNKHGSERDDDFLKQRRDLWLAKAPTQLP